MQNKKIIGIDVGGTKMEGVLFNGSRALKSHKVPTPKDLSGFKRELLELAKVLSEGNKKSLLGIGMAGVVDPGKGIILTSPNLKYIRNFKLRDFYRQQGYGNVMIDNDANCFVRAEAVLGRAKGLKNIVGIIIGTGIGSGLYINGQNYRGANYCGGEVGQLVIEGKTLERHYQKAKAKGGFGRIARLLAVRLADLANVFDPDCFVLGGSFSQFEERRFLPQTLRLMKKYLINKNYNIKIYVSRMPHSGALGASLLYFLNKP